MEVKRHELSTGAPRRDFRKLGRVLHELAMKNPRYRRGEIDAWKLESDEQIKASSWLPANATPDVVLNELHRFDVSRERAVQEFFDGTLNDRETHVFHWRIENEMLGAQIPEHILQERYGAVEPELSPRLARGIARHQVIFNFQEDEGRPVLTVWDQMLYQDIEGIDLAQTAVSGPFLYSSDERYDMVEAYAERFDHFEGEYDDDEDDDDDDTAFEYGTRDTSEELYESESGPYASRIREAIHVHDAEEFHAMADEAKAAEEVAREMDQHQRDMYVRMALRGLYIVRQRIGLE